MAMSTPKISLRLSLFSILAVAVAFSMAGSQGNLTGLIVYQWYCEDDGYYLSAVFMSPDTFDPNNPGYAFDAQDTCLSATKYEDWYCDSTNTPKKRESYCPSGTTCQGGICISDAPSPQPTTQSGPSALPTDTIDLQQGDDIPLYPQTTSSSPSTTSSPSTPQTTSSTPSTSTSSSSTSGSSVTSGRNTCIDYDQADEIQLSGLAQVLRDGIVVDSQEDMCIENRLYQVYCDSNAKIGRTQMDCGKLVCTQGTCVPKDKALAANIPPVAPTSAQRPSSDGLKVSTSYASGKTEKMPCIAKGSGLAVIDVDGRTLISLGTEEVGVDFVGEYVYIQWPNGETIEVRLDVDMGEMIREAVRLGIQTPADTAHVLGHTYNYASGSTETSSGGTSGSSYDEDVSVSVVDFEDKRVISILSGMHEWNADDGLKPEDWEETGKASESISISIYENGMISFSMKEHYSGKVYRFFFDPCGNVLSTDVSELDYSYESVENSFESIESELNYIREPAILELWKKCKELKQVLDSYDSLSAFRKFFSKAPKDEQATFEAFCIPAAEKFEWNYEWN